MDTENRQTAVRGEGVWGAGKAEGIKKKNLTDTNNSMAITGGKEGCVEGG